MLIIKECYSKIRMENNRKEDNYNNDYSRRITRATQLPPSEDGGLLWSKDHFLRLKVACRLKPVSFATKVA